MARTILLAILMLGTLTACGDTGGGTTEILVVPFLIEEGNAVSDVPGGGTTTEIIAPPPLQAGTAAGTPAPVYRVIYSYNCESLPPLDGMISAFLVLHQYGVEGQPYARLGNLVVDHVDVVAGLDPTDFDGGTLDAAFATVSTSPAIGTYSVDIYSKILEDKHAGRATTSYRLRFTIDDDGSGTANNVKLSDHVGSAPQGAFPFIEIYFRADS